MNGASSPEETLGLLPADLCLRGAGEGTIVAIAKAILGANRPRVQLAELMAAVPNLVIRTPDGIARTRSSDPSSFPREHFARLDDIPSPYQDGQIATTYVGLLTARGCNQHCTYCSFTAVSGRRIEFHGVERVLDDLAAFKPVVERSKRRLPTVTTTGRTPSPTWSVPWPSMEATPRATGATDSC